MSTERARFAPLPRQIAIDQIGAIAQYAPDTRFQLFKERELPGAPKPIEGTPGDLGRLAELRDGVRAVSAAVRLLRWRRRRLERTLAAHDARSIDSG